MQSKHEKSVKRRISVHRDSYFLANCAIAYLFSISTIWNTVWVADDGMALAIRGLGFFGVAFIIGLVFAFISAIIVGDDDYENFIESEKRTLSQVTDKVSYQVKDLLVGWADIYNPDTGRVSASLVKTLVMPRFIIIALISFFSVWVGVAMGSNDASSPAYLPALYTALWVDI